jgi:hypothetical protein
MRVPLGWLDVLGDFLRFLRRLPDDLHNLEYQWDFN